MRALVKDLCSQKPESLAGEEKKLKQINNKKNNISHV